MYNHLTKFTYKNNTLFKNITKSFCTNNTNTFKSFTEINFNSNDKEIEYEDKLYFFQQDWKKLNDEKIKFHQDFVCPELTNHQKHENEVLSNIISNFNILEKEYFYCQINKQIEQSVLEDNRYLNCNFTNNVSKLSQYQVESNVMDNVNTPLMQDLLNDLQPFISSGYFGGKGGNDGNNAGNNSEEVKEEIKEEVKKEKTIVDVKLAGFEASKKISLIKEIRTLLSLGLKEAKDVVEQAPANIKTNVKREEAEEMMNKLVAAGGIVELV